MRDETAGRDTRRADGCTCLRDEHGRVDFTQVEPEEGCPQHGGVRFTLLEGSTDMLICSMCGAVVQDDDLHSSWHLALGRGLISASVGFPIGTL